MDAMQNLSRREREIMEIVFALREGTISDIQSRMKDAPTRPALRSLLTILESKGHLTHTKRSREFVYAPTTEPERAGRSALRRVLDTFFEGSVGQALTAHLGDPMSRLSTQEVADLEAFLRQARKEQTRKGPPAR
jgi:BlaI family penicillinase repressor